MGPLLEAFLWIRSTELGPHGPGTVALFRFLVNGSGMVTESLILNPFPFTLNSCLRTDADTGNPTV